jgi:uncharacterized protein (TIGR02996 family)
MRTFQFSDAKSHKFWNIDVTGNSFTVAYGKVGTAGQTQTKSFPSAEKAQTEADKLVREKTNKGYRETTPTAPLSDADALVKGLVEHGHELVRWNVYADYLTDQGDPRGDFMRVQLALENEDLPAAERKKLKSQENKLLAAHEADWLGPFAEYARTADKRSFYISGKSVERRPVECRFERGWLAALDFADLTVNQARAYAAFPGAALVRELVVTEVASEESTTNDPDADEHDTNYAPGPDVPADIDAYEQPGLHALCRVPHLAAVRKFQLGEKDDGQEYFNCHVAGELAYHLVKQMPHVEEIGLFAHRVDSNKLFPLPMPRLRSLELFHSKSYPLDKLAANKTLTNLEVIRCHPHALDYDGEDEGGAYIRLKHLRAVCRSPHLTSLTHLCLRLTDFGDEGIEEIVSSGLLKRLKVLDLRGGCVSDAGAEALAACPDTRNLSYLNMSSNGLTADGVRRLMTLGIKVDAEGQHGFTSAGADGETAEYLFDGDIE